MNHQKHTEKDIFDPGCAHCLKDALTGKLSNRRVVYPGSRPELDIVIEPVRDREKPMTQNTVVRKKRAFEG